MHDIASDLADRKIKYLHDQLSINIVNLTVKTQIEGFTSDMLEHATKAKSDINSILSITPNVSLDFISNKTMDGEFIRLVFCNIISRIHVFLFHVIY